MKNYLYFDIECSNCHNSIGKMCEFGYIVTDDNFKTLKKGIYVMSPGKGRENRFDLKGRKNQKDLELAYDYEYYFEQPEFNKFYDKIKELVEDKDTICFAYSSSNDIVHLYNSCVRYNLPALNYKCYDVQKIAGNYLNIVNPIKLEVACDKIVGPGSRITLQEHLSRDDAIMAMMILKAICKLERCSLEELLNESSFALDIASEFIKKYLQRKLEKEEIQKRNNLYKEYAINDESKIELEEYQGKRYNLTSKTKLKIDNIQKLLDNIHSNNGIIVHSIDITDILVCFDKDNIEEFMKHFADKTNIIYTLASEIK